MSTGPQSSLTILFEAPFWIGLYERTDNGKYEVCKITFGSEPKDYEVYEFLLKNWHKLKFSPPIQAEVVIERKINPKRMPVSYTHLGRGSWRTARRRSSPRFSRLYAHDQGEQGVHPALLVFLIGRLHRAHGLLQLSVQPVQRLSLIHI